MSLTPRTPLFDGVKARLGGTEVTVPPLTFKQLRKFGPELAAIHLSGTPSIEQITPLVNVIFAALSRNYPELTLDELEDYIDLGNMRRLVLAAMAASGLEAIKDNGMGEAVAAGSIGANSTH